MKRRNTSVGLDVHQASISVAVLAEGSKFVEWTINNTAAAVEKLGRRLRRDFGDDVVVCYEAGVCGFVVMRQLEAIGVKCIVIAPALIPKQHGNKVKTDKRDARKLAQLLAAGLLVAVYPPTPEQEAARDLCRARDDAREDQMRARHRLSKFLVRHGLVYDGRAWSRQHRTWLVGLEFDRPAEQWAFKDYFGAVDAIDARLSILDERIEELAQTDDYRDAVGVLRCFHGIDTLTAMVLLTELGDITRFEDPRKLMGYLGLTPSINASGDREYHGPITKAGSRYARRILVEAAWHYNRAPRVGQALQRRRRDQPAWAIAIADKCHARLARRRRRFDERKKTKNKANVAIARELSGFLWAALVEMRRKKS